MSNDNEKETAGQAETAQMGGFDRLPWAQIVKLLGALLRVEQGRVEFMYQNRHFIASDNGGEFNLFEVIPAYFGSIGFGYHPSRIPNGPVSVACRIAAALSGEVVDYSKDEDLEPVAIPEVPHV
jgi:hypothetical protein